MHRGSWDISMISSPRIIVAVDRTALKIENIIDFISAFVYMPLQALVLRLRAEQREGIDIT